MEWSDVNDRLIIVKRPSMNQSRPVVFISYSWDSEAHRGWVLRLADDLSGKYGVDVILDQYELSAGRDLTHFMESSIEKASKVIVILTPNYKTKAEGRKGGAGAEYSMISQGIYEAQLNNKFIPVLREGRKDESCPGYLRSKVYHLMSNDSTYESDLSELTRVIYEKPKIIRPELGPVPKFDDPDLAKDPIIESANKLSKREALNRKLNDIMTSHEGVKLAQTEIKKLFKVVKRKAIHYTEKTDFKFQVREKDYSLILLCSGFSVWFNWNHVTLNTTRDSRLWISFWKGEQDHSPQNSGYATSSKPKRIRISEFEFDINSCKESIWKEGAQQVCTSEEIVAQAYSGIIDIMKYNKEKWFRY